ncbi:HAD family hydrolase [Clostridium chauvoei]|uniref:Cof-type HAD-IIB family hydrolase n=3 Tax=Clostridium chauvoei TaxID=46867 RepID=A0ABD4RJC4_9CLOT|nr:HAD family hydrolase [Clostridium chauvoei]ATD55542.1 HAD family hydrolase [Clostridium chauvoei]ATD56782.1 HAD family hydrolase [Clostridium chauvoei]MBX7281230.1 Cof-type HAD-IIB family hydrolase [Clostridium chauvoei]MBX7283712.1 Cof-type HAD-IIB family hydrolase [Clostridium chauvoei]MBX7286320.1 Cof-type HAD-IIB family hydrolase [Clostridium chauvoei]
MIKLIATDMDGTLLNSKDEINPEFYDVFKKLREKNIIFAAASGRQYYNLLKRFDAVKDDMLFIAENGTFVMCKGEELLVNALDKAVALELIEIGRSIKDCYVIVCGKNSAYVESTDERFINETKKYYERYEIVEDVTKIEDDILKVTICDLAGAEINSNKYFKKFRQSLQVTVSGEIWLDMTAKGVNKGVAIRKLQEILNIKHEETMVFGDYLNDLEMMESAYHSYAMENAHEDLKKVARFTTKSNDDNGVVLAIKEAIEI